MPVVKSCIQPSELYHDLRAMDRNNFSYDGAIALMEFLDDIEGNIEYDPIAFCCDFVEYLYSEFKQLASEYDAAPKPDDYAEEYDFAEALIDWLRDETLVIEFNSGIILHSF